MTALKVVTVRLPEDLHRLVKVRLAERGDSFEGVARAAFVAYLERGEDDPGSVLERAGVSVRGLGAGEPEVAAPSGGGVHRGGSDGPDPVVPVVPVASGRKPVSPAPSSFRPDPKVKK